MFTNCDHAELLTPKQRSLMYLSFRSYEGMLMMAMNFITMSRMLMIFYNNMI
jgi:hypothetical protein